MDSTDNFSDFSKNNSFICNDKSQTTILERIFASNTSDEKKTSLKRKDMDFIEKSTPLKLFRKKDTDQNDHKTNYALENRVKDTSDKNISSDSTDENIPFERRNFNMANKIETNFKSMSYEKNADCTMMNENEEYCESFDTVLNNWMNEICSDLNLEPISHEDLDVMIQDIDDNFLDYMDTSQNENADKSILTETEDEILSPSELEFMLPLLDNCTSLQYPTSLHTLIWKESEVSDMVGYGESSVWKCDLIQNQQHSVETVNVENNTKQIIMDEIEEETIYERPREMCYMDANGRKSFEGNGISIKPIVTDFATNDLMSMPLDDNSTKSSAISNANTFAQNDWTTNITVEQKSTKILERENISKRTTVANEKVSDRSKNKEKSKKRKWSGSKNKREILKKEATLEKERILSLIKEYFKNAKMEDFTAHDIIDFITKRIPSAPCFKIIHTVRVFVANSLKSGALKQIGYKYSLKSNISDIFV